MNKKFNWQKYPQAESFLLETLGSIKRKSKVLFDFDKRLVAQTSTRLLDWLDHILLPNSGNQVKVLTECGFSIEQGGGSGKTIYSVPGAFFPKVMITEPESEHETGVALRVESLEDFLFVHGVSGKIEGRAHSGYRQTIFDKTSDVSFFVIERKSPGVYEPEKEDEALSRHYKEALECWQSYARGGVDCTDDEQVFELLTASAKRIVSLLGSDLAAHLVLKSERDYWVSRNRAAQIQKKRQDALGLGWANHDHHTFRSSRYNFSRLIKLFTILGFYERERFYAGKEAGWGAQVMEHPAGLVLFLDVDLDPGEIHIDYQKQELPVKGSLGTVGLWCTLHGDSILKAGMHHLAINALFENLTSDLKKDEVSFMAPFSNMQHLKQAFSKAEVWSVGPERLKQLESEKLITAEKSEKFTNEGAVGSHLENIQRRKGFKGFNQTKVSNIIRRLDPRKIS